MNKLGNIFLQKYLNYLAVEKNSSSHTLENYQRDIHSFADFYKEHYQNEVLWQQVGVAQARAYLAFLNQKGYARRTVARRISSLRSFFKFLVREGLLEYNPLVRVRNPKLEKKLPVFLEEFEINELLELPSLENLGLRDRVALELLYATGCRVSELVGITLNRIDLENRYVLLSGKGNKERLVPLGHSCCQAIDHYLPLRQELLQRYRVAEHEHLLVNNRGGALTDRSVRRILEKYINQLALHKQVSPHTIRHTFATHLLNHGADLRVVQELLGHANLSTTQIYTHVTTERIADVYQKNHPRA